MNREEIEKRARDTLKKHKLYTTPVDVLALARKLNIGVDSAIFSRDGLSGMIGKRGDTTQIFVNNSDVPFRKRFTIAHEIGHYLLHLSGKDGSVVDYGKFFRETTPGTGPEWTPDRQREYEANTFASALLMDAELVQKEWNNMPLPEYLAERFEVSLIAMVYKLKQMGLVS